MIKEFSFRFDELVLDLPLLEQSLGFGEGPLPEPIDEYLAEALAFAVDLPDIRCAYRLVDLDEPVHRGHKIVAEGIEFHVGHTVRHELKKSERLAFFICTAGAVISERSKALLLDGDPVLGYVYDLVGSFVAESAGDKMQEILLEQVSSSGEKITNRYSPGYCQWSVSEQHKLFSLFPDRCCGVSLTPSALMHPVKSISGVIGVGKEVKFREYRCAVCSSTDCVYRQIHQRSVMA